MKTEIQDQAWASLPEDFRRVVRKEYKTACDIYEADSHNVRAEANYKLMEKIFGHHNLTAVEKPQPRFKVGDKVWVNTLLSKDLGVVKFIDPDRGTASVELPQGTCNWAICSLEPYTSPESKVGESGEKGNDSEDPLNLCELLKGHEGETFYSPIAGKCRLTEINEGAAFPICIILDACTAWEYLTKDGKRFNISDARCILYPSRALYEQYPLDACTAWKIWQDEHKTYSLVIDWQKYDNRMPSGGINLPAIYFRTSSDRDKCIEEIKSVIGKYSK